jgi:hypothetical protein
MQIVDMDQVRADAMKHGRHFFSPGAMRFFDSRISRYGYQVDATVYFVTSERFEASFPRLYTVRAIDMHSWDVTTYPNQSAFQAYTTARAAHKKARAIAQLDATV